MNYEKNILCFDVDGTLCEDRYPELGAPNAEIIALMTRLHEQGYYIIVNSSRRSLDHDQVQHFLHKHAIPYDQLCIGMKPVADVFIDDRGLWTSPRLLEMFIEQRFLSSQEYLTALASEHLASAFAANVRDVPEAGGGSHHDTHFTIGLAMTGGMDSTTMWQILEEGGSPYRMFYFDMGQAYAADELAAIRTITGREAEVVHLPMSFVQHKYILSGRNAVILLSMAQLLTQDGGWGELWFGNLQGESPVVGGDKSSRFFNDMAALFALKGLDVRLVNPLIGMDKTDEVRYWQARGRLDLLKQTKSCFAAQEWQCGRCQTCFRKWAAFVSAGVDCTDIFPVTHFEEHVAKYERVMGEALARQDFSHYSPARIRHTLMAIEQWHRAREGTIHVRD